MSKPAAARGLRVVRNLPTKKFYGNIAYILKEEKPYKITKGQNRSRKPKRAKQDHEHFLPIRWPIYHWRSEFIPARKSTQNPSRLIATGATGIESGAMPRSDEICWDVIGFGAISWRFFGDFMVEGLCPWRCLASCCPGMRSSVENIHAWKIFCPTFFWRTVVRTRGPCNATGPLLFWAGANMSSQRKIVFFATSPPFYFIVAKVRHSFTPFTACLPHSGTVPACCRTLIAS